MENVLADYIPKIEDLARELGLDYHPVDFQEVPPSFMMEVAVYGLPVRMPHWSFGVRWIYQMVQHQMGHSRIFEVVFPGNPNRAYLVTNNSLVENILVVAHVLGHADFSRNNLEFLRSQEQAGYHIVEQAAAHARLIEEAAAEHGRQKVEKVLDAALALEQCIDSRQPLNRLPYPKQVAEQQTRDVDEFRSRYEGLPSDATPPEDTPDDELPAPVPPHPESDLLWFIARYAPNMQDWERDIFLAVREESWYFQPVFNCQIMNEGWACHWHARLLREAGFLTPEMYVDAMKTHSDVVRPYAGGQQVALSINPYHLGYQMWDRIVSERGVDEARRIMREEDDFGFVRNYLDKELADELDLFVYEERSNGEIKAKNWDLDELHESILGPKYNFGAPQVAVDALGANGSLTLRHDYGADGRGLDAAKAQHVLRYVDRVWRGTVELYTVDVDGNEVCLTANATS